jgi:hypothetical protein
MIRIHVHYNEANTRLVVEGKLAQSWVDELESCWRAAIAHAPHQPVHVHLADVFFIDDRGRALLKQMSLAGVELQAAGVMTRAIVEEITKEN